MEYRRDKRAESRLFSSKRVFLILFSLFLVVALIRFIAIKKLDTESTDNYIYTFNGDIFDLILHKGWTDILREAEWGGYKTIIPYLIV